MAKAGFHFSDGGALAARKAVSKRIVQTFEKQRAAHWLDRLLSSVELPKAGQNTEHAEDTAWFAQQAIQLIDQGRQAVSEYLPWLLADFAPLCADAALAPLMNCDAISLQRLPDCIEQLRAKLEASITLGMEHPELRESTRRFSVNA